VQPAADDGGRPGVRRQAGLGRRDGQAAGILGRQSHRQFHGPGAQPARSSGSRSLAGAGLADDLAQRRGPAAMVGGPGVEPGRQTIGQAQLEVRHHGHSVHTRRRQGYPALDSAPCLRQRALEIGSSPRRDRRVSLPIDRARPPPLRGAPAGPVERHGYGRRAGPAAVLMCLAWKIGRPMQPPSAPGRVGR
jgi:hypothetical protein